MAPPSDTLSLRQAIPPASLAIVAALAFSCSSGNDSGCTTSGTTGPTPEPDPALLGPRYVLDRVGSAPLPVTLSQTGTRTERLLADTLFFTAASATASTGTFVEVSIIETRDGTAAPVAAREQSAPGARTFARTNAFDISVSALARSASATAGALTPNGATQSANLEFFVVGGAPWFYVPR